MRKDSEGHPRLYLCYRQGDGIPRRQDLLYCLRLATHELTESRRRASLGTSFDDLPHEDKGYRHRGSFEVKMMKGVLRRSPEEVFPEVNETVDEGDGGTEHHQ